MKKYFYIIGLILISIFELSAQNNNLNGKVYDSNTGDALVGATVILTSLNPVKATVTDYNGNYTISNIPAGNHTIKCTFISYQDITITDIKIEKEKNTTIEISLNSSSKDIAEIIVSANAQKRTENSLLVMQKKSATLINGISSENFGKMGDGDAASALKRVTGVSVEGGKYVFVRGLSDRYTKIALNGSEIPGLDPNRNTVQLDLFSTNIIENIVIQKTYSADLPASFAGGYVNVSTKAFPNEFSLQITSSFGYNKNSNLNDKFLSYNGGKLDWIGIDDGSRAIPEQAENVPFLYENNDALDQVTASFNKDMQPVEKTSFLNHSHSFSIGNQTKLFKKPLGYIFDLSYTREFKAYSDGIYQRYNLVTNADNTQSVMNPLLIETETLGEEDVIISALAGLSYKITPYNKIGLTIMRNGGGLISARNRTGSKIDDNLFISENTMGYQQREFISAQLIGSHVFVNKNNAKIDWISSYTNSNLNEPDLRFFNYDFTHAGGYNISYSAYPAPARFYRDMNEINYDNKIHFEIPYSKFVIKFGASYTAKLRESNSRKFDILSQGLQFNGNISEYLSDENIGQNAEDALYGVYYQNDPLTDQYNSYIAQEHLAGSYLMTETSLGNNFQIQAGVRYEFDYTNVYNLVPDYHPKYVSASKTYYLDFLPALNLNYNLNSTSNLRFAYSRTLGRPAFREIAPYAYYDFKEGWRVVGNPDLERGVIDNLDLRWEKFMSNNQIVSISGFVKYFTKPIELVDDPRANNPELHYVNVDNSFLYGLEMEVRKNFGFIGVEDLLIGGNFTLIQSQVKYVEEFGGTTIETANRPMYGQSPWVVNCFLSYENQELGLSSNLGFNVDGKKLAVVTKGSTPDVYSNPIPSLNYNISQQFGKISIKLSVGNILNPENKKTYTIDNQEFIFQSFKLGRTYSFSIKYFIN